MISFRKSKFEHILKYILVLVMLFSIFFTLKYQLSVLTYRYSLDYGEAILADQSINLSQKGNIYRLDLSKPPYTITNYPPVFISTLAILIKAFGITKAFILGRSISIISTWVAFAIIIMITYKTTRDKLSSFTAGALFITFPIIVFWSPLVRVDMLAVSLSLASLFFVSKTPTFTKRTLFSGLLLILSFYTRQTYGLAMPLTIFFWYLHLDWRFALRYMLLILGVTAVLFFLLNSSTGGGFYFNVVTSNIHEYSFLRLFDALKYFWKTSWIFLIVGYFSLFYLLSKKKLSNMVIIPYLLGSTLSALTVGKIGSNYNHFIELCASLSLSVGIVFAWNRHSIKHVLQPIVMPFIVVIGIFIMVGLSERDFIKPLYYRKTMYTDFQTLENYVIHSSGPILADEFLSMVTLQGKTIYLNPFDMTLSSLNGKWNQDPLLNDIRDKKFPYIFMYEEYENDRWTDEMRTTISEFYQQIDTVAGNRVYITR